MEWKWTKPRVAAALMVAEDTKTHRAIAAECGIASSTLQEWKLEPQFKARVAEHVAEFERAALSSGIANRWQRLRRLDRDWRRAQALIDARANEMAGKTEGGDTGLLARDEKSIGSGILAERVTVYRADTALLAEIRNIEKQAAEELGQWVSKHELRDTTPARYNFDALSDEELDELDRITAAIEVAGAEQPG